MEKQKEVTSWMDGIDKEKVKKSAGFEGEVFPKLELMPIPEGMKQGPKIKVTILEEEPKVVKGDFKFGKVGFPLLVEKDGVKHNYWLNESAKYHFAVLKEKYGSVVGMTIAVWQEWTDLEKYGKTVVNNMQKLD